MNQAYHWVTKRVDGSKNRSMLIGENKQNCESMQLPSVNQLLLPPQQALENDYVSLTLYQLDPI